MKELAKQYDPSQVEDRVYQFWLDGGYFHTKADPNKKPYTIVMPPPNVISSGRISLAHTPAYARKKRCSGVRPSSTGSGLAAVAFLNA